MMLIRAYEMHLPRKESPVSGSSQVMQKGGRAGRKIATVIKCFDGAYPSAGTQAGPGWAANGAIAVSGLEEKASGCQGVTMGCLYP